MSLEWAFGEIASYFKFCGFKKSLKIGLSPVGKICSVCALLRNASTFLYGSNTADYFEVQPPALQYYLNGNQIVNILLNLLRKQLF